MMLCILFFLYNVVINFYWVVFLFSWDIWFEIKLCNICVFGVNLLIFILIGGYVFNIFLFKVFIYNGYVRNLFFMLLIMVFFYYVLFVI